MWMICIIMDSIYSLIIIAKILFNKPFSKLKYCIRTCFTFLKGKNNVIRLPLIKLIKLLFPAPSPRHRSTPPAKSLRQPANTGSALRLS